MIDRPDNDNPKPFSQRSDQEIRQRAREEHEQSLVIEIPDDARVTRKPDDHEIVEIEAVIILGLHD